MEDIFSLYVKTLTKETARSLLDDILEVCKAPTRRKFASSRILLDFFTLEEFLDKNPCIIYELLKYNSKARDNSPVVLISEILTKKFKLVAGDLKTDNKSRKKHRADFIARAGSWVDFWMPAFLKIIQEVSRRDVHDIVRTVLPSIFQVMEEAIVTTVNRLEASGLKGGNIQAAKVGLYRLARSLGYLNVNKSRTGYEMVGMETQPNW